MARNRNLLQKFDGNWNEMSSVGNVNGIATWEWDGMRIKNTFLQTSIMYD